MANMAPEDLEIAEKLCISDLDFKKLWEEHISLKTRISELSEKRFLTSDEEMEIKKLKRQKLLGKEKIIMKINDYKVGVSQPA